MRLASERYTDLQMVAKVHCKTRAEFASTKSLVIEYHKGAVIDAQLFPLCAEHISIIYSGDSKVDELDLRGHPALKHMSFHTVVRTSTGKTAISSEMKDGVQHTMCEWATLTELHEHLAKEKS